MSSFLPVMSGLQDQTGHLSESALISSNYRCFRDTVIRNTKGSPFSIPLPAGMTLGADKLPLSKVPLEIEIHLAPDSQFFYSSSGTTTNISDSFYELSGVELTCEVDVGDESPDQGAWSFNSVSSYFSTLESTNSIINYQLGLSKVLGAFVNFVPSSFVNNLTEDGYLTYMPSQADGSLANLDTISFLRNGERFPLSFEVDSVYNTINNLNTVVDSQVIKGFLNSIIPESQHNRTGAGPLTTNRSFTVDTNAATGYRLMPQAGAIYGVGVLYDMLDADGVDFSRAQFSVQMTNGLEDGYLTYMPSQADGSLANLDTISFLRNGERFPLSFEVDSVYNTINNLNTVVDSQVIKGFLNSIIPESQHNRTGAGPLTTNRSFTVDTNAATGYRLMPQAGAIYGVGVLYDMLDADGVDFSRAQFSVQMTNGLEDGNPVSAYLFVKSKVVVAYDSSAGVQVVM